MKILVIAPQPFYQERGTPIAVRLTVEALARQLPELGAADSKIDLLVYGEGEEIDIPGVNIIRAKTPRWLHGVRPGVSCKKLVCDVLLFFYALRLLFRERANQYDLIHAVEEGVFFAWLVKKVLGIPYIYDMDSSLALQLTERWRWGKPFLGLFQFIDGVAVRGSLAVAPVCNALQTIAQQHGSAATILLRDVSLLPATTTGLEPRSRSDLYSPSISEQDLVILYVGNLESYQGIDLLIESFALICDKHRQAKLVIVGGTEKHIKFYRAKAAELCCESNIVFSGPKPLQLLPELLRAADILVSPRIMGNNTPMKVYSYLHSGTALVATDLPTHRQALDDSMAVLATPTPLAFAQGLESLITDPQRRKSLGNEARVVAEQLYTVEAFERQVGALYSTVIQNMRTSDDADVAACENL